MVDKKIEVELFPAPAKKSDLLVIKEMSDVSREGSAQSRPSATPDAGQLTGVPGALMLRDLKYVLVKQESSSVYFLNAPYPLCTFKNGLRHMRRQSKTSTWDSIHDNRAP